MAAHLEQILYVLVGVEAEVAEVGTYKPNHVSADELHDGGLGDVKRITAEVSEDVIYVALQRQLFLRIADQHVFRM